MAKKSASDIVLAGWEKDIAEKVPDIFTRADDLGTGRVQWLWTGRILEEKVNLIQGWKGSGKSTACASIASAIIHGKKLPDNFRKVRKGGVCLWLTTEESSETDVKPRWEMQGGDLKSLYCFNPKKERHMMPTLPGDVITLAAQCRAINCRIMVIDPFSSLGSKDLDINSEQSCRAYMESLKYLCEKANLTVLLIQHLRKGKSGGVIEAGIGSVAIPNVARIVLRADKHPSKSDEFLLSVVASNAGKRPLPTVYKLSGERDQSPLLTWGETEDIHLEEILDAGRDAGTNDESLDARSLLTNALKDGSRPAKEILAEARVAGIGERSIRSEKAKLGIVSIRKSIDGSGEGQWVWEIPPQVPPDTPA